MLLPSRPFVCAVLAASLLSAGLLAACAAAKPPPPPPVASTPAPAVSPSASPTSTLTSTPAPGITPSVTPSAAPSTTPQAGPLCSPLEGEALEALSSPELLKNPFAAPRPGYDDGHPGMDLAYWSSPDGKPMLGLSVHSILDGKVAMVIANRQPYGNAVIIETALTQPAYHWLEKFISTTPAQTLQPSFSLSCPDYADFKVDSHATSLYVLYAHLENTPTLQPGQTVACAQPIGQVGTTGRSVNPHLHIEIRPGPAGVRFASMAHYDPAASQDEMRAYCLWRVSGAFPPLDPLPLLTEPH